MSWWKLTCLSYFFVFTGITKFYFNVKSGKFIKSRWLCWYSRIIGLILLVAVPFQLYRLWAKPQVIMSDSKLTFCCVRMYPAVKASLIVSSLYSVHRWQPRILKLFENLLDMEAIEFEPYFYEANAEHRSRLQLLGFRIILFLPTTLISIRWTFIEETTFMGFIITCIGRNLVNSLTFLLFAIIWQICQVALRMSISLEYLLHHPRPEPIQLQKIQHIQRIFYRFIYMVNELCTIFKYQIICYSMYIANHTCFNLYLYIRFMGGEPLVDHPLNSYMLVGLLNFIELLNLWILATVSYTASKVIGNALNILRYPTLNVDSLDRSNDWFGLQLCRQNINICMFGVFSINLKLLFSMVTNVILFVIYMIQSDYNFIDKV
ncbi:hypothetical protein KR215_012034 [Drosophila sulfurigaster]|nr:hypothetical protein KR215_012034 [Drosophila sulfurigaster]